MGAKVLIGVAPSGACTFCSGAFEGSISDKGIVLDSGFLDHVQLNDLILADRGFHCFQEFAERGAKLLIPAFLSKRDSFSLREVRLTKLVAKARIHVERFNQRLKQWKF